MGTKSSLYYYKREIVTGALNLPYITIGALCTLGMRVPCGQFVFHIFITLNLGSLLFLLLALRGWWKVLGWEGRGGSGRTKWRGQVHLVHQMKYLKMMPYLYCVCVCLFVTYFTRYKKGICMHVCNMHANT